MTPFRVLVIDGDRLLARMIELALGQMGNLVFHHAGNGQVGTQLASRNPPDLILLGFDLPMMDGLETLRRLRADERTARTPIVAIAEAHRTAPRCVEMINSCDAHVPKPFELRVLRQTVHLFLNAPRSASV